MTTTRLHLIDLAQFRIDTVQSYSEDMELRGTFSHFTRVEPGRAWLYQPDQCSISGELISVNKVDQTGLLMTSIIARDYGVVAGAAFPYFYGIWEPYDIELVLANHSWQRIQYQPSKADGIDHEECRLCHDKLGPRFQPFGYRRAEDISRLNKQGPWLCERCYSSYAARHDLAFVYEL